MSQMFRFDEVENAAVPYHSFLKKLSSQQVIPQQVKNGKLIQYDLKKFFQPIMILNFSLNYQIIKIKLSYKNHHQRTFLL
jgi:hypothetical protein